ncbi:MAG TPA: NAD(+)/NADH kinase [Dehalococcoidia bacterium]|nr:NAD(+)/NADH kinase [Dehalococcoidia bacterium]
MTDAAPTPPRRIGLTYNPRLEGARALAEKLRGEIAGRGLEAWIEDETEDEVDGPAFSGADLVVCLGGDGTVLRCAHLVNGSQTLILGVNLGRLGFLTELDASQIEAQLGDVLAGGGRIETRTMIRAAIDRTGDVYHGLNEAVVGRATLSRAIQLAVDVDDQRIADYRCDGVIVASATGSTAYALSVGGPVIHPEASELVLVPVAPHLAAANAVVLPGSARVRLTLEPRQEAVLSIDGVSDFELREGDSVVVTRSDHQARFLRLKPPTDFYQRMAAQLGWHRPGGTAQPLPTATGKRASGQTGK